MKRLLAWVFAGDPNPGDTVGVLVLGIVWILAMAVVPVVA